MSANPINDGGPAFPGDEWTRGMSLRDWFAGQALPSIVSLSLVINGDDDAAEKTRQTIRAEAAQIAYRWADAMLAERSREP